MEAEKEKMRQAFRIVREETEEKSDKKEVLIMKQRFDKMENTIQALILENRKL